jgi:hypothetical protein
MAIHRRDMLQGLSLGSGAVMLSPFLRTLAAENRAAMPKRFVFIVKSSGIDVGNLVADGLPAYEGKRDQLVDVSLQDQRLPEIFKPFEGMKNRLTILQGLSGNNLKGNHTSGFGTLSCRNSELAPMGPSVDALLGIHHSTGPYPMFGFATNGVLRGQASVPSDAYVYPTMSAYKKGQAVAYQASPTKAFNELFGSAVLPAHKLKNESIIKRNVMDFLKDDAGRIRKRLGADDREQFDGYINTFESLKVREQRKAVLKNKIKTFMPDYDADNYTKMQHMPRMEAQLEMGAAALIAGLTNVVSYRLDTLGSMYQDLGIGSMGLHAIGHGGTSKGYTSVEMRRMIDAYHLKLIHDMALKFEAIKEGGGTMLDSTMIVYLSCAGGKHHGGNTDWPVVLVGGMANKIKMGRYIAYPSYTQIGHRPLSTVYQSLMAASGIEIGETFGDTDPALKDLDIKGPLTELMA